MPVPQSAGMLRSLFSGFLPCPGWRRTGIPLHKDRRDQQCFLPFAAGFQTPQKSLQGLLCQNLISGVKRSQPDMVHGGMADIVKAHQ